MTNAKMTSEEDSHHNVRQDDLVMFARITVTFSIAAPTISSIVLDCSIVSSIIVSSSSYHLSIVFLFV